MMQLKGSSGGSSFGSSGSSGSSGASAAGGGFGCLLWFLVAGLVSFVICWAFLDMDPKTAAEYGLGAGTAVAGLACFGPLCLILGIFGVALLVLYLTRDRL